MAEVEADILADVRRLARRVGGMVSQRFFCAGQALENATLTEQAKKIADGFRMSLHLACFCSACMPLGSERPFHGCCRAAIFADFRAELDEHAGRTYGQGTLGVARRMVRPAV